MAGFEFRELRKRGLQTQPVGRRDEDPRHERFRDFLQRFAAEAASHERSERFVGAAPARKHKVERHPDLAGQGQESTARNRRDASGNGERHPGRERMKLAAGEHEKPPAARRDEPVAEPQFPAKIRRPGLCRDERVRSALN